jgi:uncharacterized protein (TIGR02594 family)
MTNDFPKHFVIAQQELGTQEIVGDEDNPRVVEYQQATGLAAPDDETPWCGSFVAWVMLQSGIAYNRITAASSRSWESWGVPVDKPEIGDVVILWRHSPDSSLGHVGFYAGKTDDDRILILGGNQNNRVSVSAYSKARLIGYRRAPGLMEAAMSDQAKPALKFAEYNKLTFGVVGAAMATLAIKFIESNYGITFSGDEQTALTLVISWLLTWLVPNAPRLGGK